LINQMSRCLHHPPGIARGTDSAAFTGEGDKEIVTAAGTSVSGKAMRQDATLEIFAEILLDVRGNRTILLIRLPAASQVSR